MTRAATTLAIYFMYDVKQYDPKEWSSPPLEGRIVDRPGVGKIMVGRGTTNTKGPQMACLAAMHAFKAAKQKLPINLVLVCEGEEEIGSPNFREIVFKPEVEAALRKAQEARAAGVALFAVGVGPDLDRGLLEQLTGTAGRVWTAGKAGSGTDGTGKL